MTIPSAGRADVAGGVTRDDLAVWDQEFRDVCARLDGLFYRTDSRAHARHYVRGLIAPLERKNGWTIAEYSGDAEPKALQRLLNLSPWMLMRRGIWCARMRWSISLTRMVC